MEIRDIDILHTTTLLLHIIKHDYEIVMIVNPCIIEYIRSLHWHSNASGIIIELLSV